MQVAFDALELREAWLDSDPSARWRLNLALSETTGTKSCSLIYFELDPGCRLPRHIDGAEEILLILSGSAALKVAAPARGSAAMPQTIRGEPSGESCERRASASLWSGRVVIKVGTSAKDETEQSAGRLLKPLLRRLQRRGRAGRSGAGGPGPRAGAPAPG
jgi:hypothetical protein